MDNCELNQLWALLKPAVDLEKVEISKSALRELLKLKQETCEGCALAFGLVFGGTVGVSAVFIILMFCGKLQ